MTKTFSDDEPTSEGFRRFHTTHFITAAYSGNSTTGWCDLHFFTPEGEPNYCTLLSPQGVQSLAGQLKRVSDALPTQPPIPVHALKGQLPGSITYGPHTKTYFGQRYDLRVIQALGVLTIRANLLDQLLIELTIQLTGGNPRQVAAQYYSSVNMKARLDNVRALLEVSDLPSDLTARLRETLDKVKKVTDRRNDLIHAQWTFRKGKHRAVLYRPISKVKEAEITVTEQLVLGIADGYGEAYASLLSGAQGVQKRKHASSTARTPSSADPAS